MSAHNDIGRQGEVLAKIYFEEAGYEIVHSNWRYRHWEIDLIATRKNMLHFIEVKTLSSAAFGYPEDKVDAKKIRFLIQAADEFLHLHPHWTRIQFDVLAITLKKPVEYFLIEDIYL